MKTVELECFECKKLFVKEKKEYDRRMRKGHTRFFCSLSCSMVYGNREIPRKHVGHIENLPVKKMDELSPFRWFTRRIRTRQSYSKTKKKFTRIGLSNISENFLKELWHTQTGTCPFTGNFLNLPRGSCGWDYHKPNNGSLDRINNEVGYIVENVRFISLMANYARNIFSDEELIDFCQIVANAHQYDATIKMEWIALSLNPTMHDQDLSVIIQHSKSDVYSPFKWFSKILRNRAKEKREKYGIPVSEYYLKNLWDLQLGMCPFTNQTMILPKNSGEGGQIKLSPYNASLDRIDNSKGYVAGNVRFVSLMANYARNTFTDEQVIEFCKEVANHNKCNIAKKAS